MKSCIGLIVLIFPFHVLASVEADSLVRIYDDGETYVASPHLRVKSTIAKDSVEIGAGYAMDIVTSSSCDVRSWSSTGKIADTRREESADLGLNLQNGSFSAGYVQSDENDYHSKAFSAGMTRDFFEKNTTLDLGFSFGDDHVQSSKDSNLDQIMQNESMSLGLTQVLSPVSVIQLLYDFRIEKGFLNGPYRVARLLQDNGTVIGLPENTPLSRGRNSLALKYNYYLKGVGISFANTLRGYTDSWGVTSQTYEGRLSKGFGNSFSLTLNFRYYNQTAAGFYQDKYNLSSMGPYYTGNKTLSQYYTALVGLRPTVRLFKVIELYGKYEYYIEKFQNFTDVGNPLDAGDDKLYSITAQVIGVGLTGKF